MKRFIRLFEFPQLQVAVYIDNAEDDDGNTMIDDDGNEVRCVRFRTVLPNGMRVTMTSDIPADNDEYEYLEAITSVDVDAFIDQFTGFLSEDPEEEQEED